MRGLTMNNDIGHDGWMKQLAMNTKNELEIEYENQPLDVPRLGYVKWLESKVVQLQIELAPLQQQFDDWAKQNRHYRREAKEAVEYADYAHKRLLEATDKLNKFDDYEEALSTIWGLSLSYDGFDTVEGLKSLVDDMAEIAHKGKV